MSPRHSLYILLILLFAACGGKLEEQQSDNQPVDTIPMMVMRIQKCSKLYTSEYLLHKIVTYGDSASINGTFLHRNFKVNLPFGKRRVAIPITASVKAYIDFGNFSEKNVRRHGDKVEIILPDPGITMTSTQVDHEAIKKRVPMLRSNFTDEEITHIQQQGRQEMINSIAKLGIVENARLSATRQLIPIIEQMGYKEDNVTITFRKKYSIDDLSSIIKTID